MCYAVIVEDVLTTNIHFYSSQLCRYSAFQAPGIFPNVPDAFVCDDESDAHVGVDVDCITFAQLVHLHLTQTVCAHLLSCLRC